MGKYKNLRGKLEPFQLEAPYQKRVNDEKRRLLGIDDPTGEIAPEFTNVQTLATQLAELKREKKQHEDDVEELNVTIEALSQLLVDALECETIQRVELVTGELVTLADTPLPQVVDAQLFNEYVEKEGLTALKIFPWQTLKGICIDLLKDGKTLPQGVKCFIKTEARVYNAGRKRKSADSQDPKEGSQEKGGTEDEQRAASDEV